MSWIDFADQHFTGLAIVAIVAVIAVCEMLGKLFTGR